jgi:dihydroorotase
MFQVSLRTAQLIFAAGLLSAQTNSLILRGGHVIDPANGIDGVMDVAVSGNRITGVGPNLTASPGAQVIDVSKFYVVPGLVDLHMHVFGYEGAIDPDENALAAGTTTIVDAGGSGWRTFDEFHKTVMAHAKTRVLALLNIVGAGMVGEPYESNTEDMEPEKTAEMIKHHRDVIVGIKTAHFGGTGWTAIDRAVAAGRLTGVPIMVDDKIFTNTGRTSREELLEHLRPGDIHTHMYNDRQIELLDRFTGKVQPYMVEARKRGVLFDLGHGAGSFLWPVANKAMAQEFYPDTISTDLHTESVMRQRSDMPNCMSKLMLLGMSLNDAVLRSTMTPAKAIHRFPELGTLGKGQIADIAVLDLQTGVFPFVDSWPAKRLGTKRLQCVLTVRDGKVVYQRQEWTSHPMGPIYDVLLKNGHVIDPANHRNGRFDVAIASGKIAKVAPGLHAAQARIVLDASDYVVTPGLIEISETYRPDTLTLTKGATTLVIVGDTVPKLSAHMKTRVLAVPTKMATSGARPGMTPETLIEQSTVSVARAIHKPELGTLAEGSDADVALFESDKGKLQCVLTVRHGAVVWDAEGLATMDWAAAGAYTNFK